MLGGDQIGSPRQPQHGLALANNGGPGQLVNFGGTREQLDSFAIVHRRRPVRSSSCRYFSRTGPLHPAVARVSEIAATYAVNDADIPLISNATARW